MARGISVKALAVLAAITLVAAACTRDEQPDEGDQTTTEQGDTGGGGQQQQESLLDVVRSRGTVVCGVNDTVPGFGFLTAEGSIEGFDIDFCKAIAAGVLGDPAAHELVPVTADERFNSLRAGQYDVLVRNTTWTSSRDGSEGVAFTHVNFYDGQAMMVRAGEFAEVADMDGTTVCVTAGTTTELNLADYAQQLGIQIDALVLQSNDDILPAFEAGRCDGWTSDSSQLAGLRSEFEELLGDLEILPDVMSKEPLGPAVLDGDSAWYDAVSWVVKGLILAEELGVTSENVDEEAANPSNPQIGNLLGAPTEEGAPFDPGLGLEPDFMVAVLQAVGNYGEIFERHVGANTPLGLERGLNALWTEGGLHYAPPFR
ncbi:MAG: amino acid ABC transporter substrate-binding protein [Actinobacteria bacterium]|nr:amino acid ABC transporter substrate-binding protein [Actinomycetota bacterium]